MKMQKIMRIFRFCLPVALVIAWSGSPLRAQSQVSGNPICLEEAAKKIHSEDKITLVLRDREQIKGKLVSIDTEQLSLSLSNLDQVNSAPSVYQLSDIKKIEYNGGGKLKRTVLGLLIGGGIGALIGSTGESDCAQEFGCIEGFPTAGGAVIGGIIGLSIGLALPSTRVIECP